MVVHRTDAALTEAKSILVRGENLRRGRDGRKMLGNIDFAHVDRWNSISVENNDILTWASPAGRLQALRSHIKWGHVSFLFDWVQRVKEDPHSVYTHRYMHWYKYDMICYTNKANLEVFGYYVHREYNTKTTCVC